MSEKDKVMSDLRVGVVAFAALVCLVAGISFAGGDKGLLFHNSSTLRACMNDVGGLKKGGTVTMGGMAIGKVTAIEFNQNTAGCLIQVTMEIRGDVRTRIKTDSVPQVRTQGMLGDRYVEITAGSPEAPVLAEGERLNGLAATAFDDTLREAQKTLSEMTKMLQAVNEPRGSMGYFLYDPTFYQQLTTITKETQDLIEDFKKQPRKYIKFSVF